ncbi:CBO0543 family protein [Mesobacillus jeotgali]|uniref:CBO0543 family protein n=1 Tax=Mesobacillus jeotgali TaxID=129985 RepID=UPI0009A602CF|nr:CBO0543 family protein [Mesobacillus jeotgali]
MFTSIAGALGHQLNEYFMVAGSISLQELLEAEAEYHRVLKQYWQQNNYLTYKWWFLVILSIIPAIIWWIKVDKTKLIENTAFGLFYGVTAIFLDSIGSNAMVWTYPVRLTPYLNPQLYPYDVGVVIIPFMMLYERFSKSFKKFFIATGLLSLFLAFVAEPFMVYLGIYKEIIWKHIYSFPIYWLVGLMCWGIINKFKSYSAKS